MTNFEEIIGKMMDECSISFISCVDEDGFPITKAMLKPRNREGIKTFYYASTRSSLKTNAYKNNSKASVYIADAATYKGISLIGKMEVLDEKDIRVKTWQDTDQFYFPSGIDDPEYVVFKFTTEKGRYYHDLISEDFEIE